VRVAVEMAEEGLIGRDAALLRVEPEALGRLLHPTLAADPGAEEIARGLPASPGAAVGALAFTAAAAERLSASRPVVLCRDETSPEDIQGMHVSAGVLTARGGMTSHAAVVARGMGRPCVVGASSLRIDEEAGVLEAGGRALREGDEVTVDGSGGRVLLGAARMAEPESGPEFARLMEWADARRRLRVRANAETPEDCRAAVRFGAEGVGLCRTEHMFFHPGRMLAMREMIVADGPEGRRRALERLLPEQRADFEEIFRVMEGRPVTVRLLDPPLHEFLPRGAEEQAALAEAMGVAPRALRERLRRLSETNPMLGHRGCRLAVTFPEIYEMQLRALFAAVRAVRESGAPARPEVMIPLVAFPEELRRLRAMVERVAAEEGAGEPGSPGGGSGFLVGTMVELPRAALCAGALAESADFFSFGTNDLTQTALGLSRDDAGSFLPRYQEEGIVPRDPFASLDREGVGALVETACRLGRAADPSLKLGVCGEHGGDPDSVAFFESLGLDYVSCSPFRLPVARLAAARAAAAAGGGRGAGEGEELAWEPRRAGGLRGDQAGPVQHLLPE